MGNVGRNILSRPLTFVNHDSKTIQPSKCDKSEKGQGLNDCAELEWRCYWCIATLQADFQHESIQPWQNSPVRRMNMCGLHI